MTLSSPFFLFLALPFGLSVFYFLSRRFGTTAGLASMFVLSLCAYASWGLRNVALLLASVLVNFAVAQALIGIPDAKQSLRRSMLWLGQSYNFLTLIWFKYGILQASLHGVLGDHIEFRDVALPAGISFYTFQQAALLMDAYYRDKAVVAYFGELSGAAARLANFVRYAAFATFFPQLIIGPISYLREFQPQVASGRFGRFRQTDMAVGLALVGIGMFKKLVIADNLGAIADPVFALAAHGANIHPLAAWAGVLAYYPQLYFDFSGYADMALGITRMFGITLAINFFSPLKAVGIIDYYRRWHMTLTRVISRFLFTPLSLAGSRWAMARRLPKSMLRPLGLWIPLLLNFEVIALWHGANSTFIVFGLIHGTWYVIETEARTTGVWKSWRKRTPNWLRTLLGRMVFLVPMCLTFALFRSENLEAARHLLTLLTPAYPGGHHSLEDMTAQHELAQTVGMHVHASGTSAAIQLAISRLHAHAPLMLLAYVVVYLCPNSIELTRRWKPGFLTYENRSYSGLFKPAWRPDWRWTAFWLVLVCTSLYFVARQKPFIYMEF